MLFRKGSEEIGLLTVIMLVYIFLTSYVFIFSDRGYINYKKIKEKELFLKKEIKELEIKKLFMQQRIRSLSSSKHLYESIAREKLEMVKPNETVFQIEYINSDE